jgi:hypothetical protein
MDWAGEEQINSRKIILGASARSETERYWLEVREERRGVGGGY